MPAWLVKTDVLRPRIVGIGGLWSYDYGHAQTECTPPPPKSRRAPSRHSRDARVYGSTTTAMHELSAPPPPPPSPRGGGENRKLIFQTPDSENSILNMSYPFSAAQLPKNRSNRSRFSRHNKSCDDTWRTPTFSEEEKAHGPCVWTAGLGINGDHELL